MQKRYNEYRPLPDVRSIILCLEFQIHPVWGSVRGVAQGTGMALMTVSSFTIGDDMCSVNIVYIMSI